jgi:hypothetical protein
MKGKNAILTAAGAALILGFAVGVAPALAQVAAIQSQETNAPGVSADLIEAKRSDGVLSIRVRLKNAGPKETSLHFNLNRFADKFYVQAENKKYFVLRDTEKVPLGDPVDYAHVKPGASYTFWAKYPAPPANVKKFSFNWPLGAPFDDVPITDK